MRFNPDQAAKLTYLLPVFFHLRVFCNLRIIKVLHFLRVVIPAKVLPKCVLQYGIPKVQLIQPVQMLLRPGRFSLKAFPVPNAEGQYLLFDCLELRRGRIPHPHVFLYRVVLFCWNVDRAVKPVCKTIGNVPGVSRICFDLPVGFRVAHR